MIPFSDGDAVIADKNNCRLKSLSDGINNGAIGTESEKNYFCFFLVRRRCAILPRVN